MKIRLILCTILLCSLRVIGGDNQKNNYYYQDGVSITITPQWRLQTEEDLNNKGYYLTFLPSETNNESLVSLIWINQKMDIYETILNHKEQLSKSAIFNGSDIIFSHQDTIIFHNKQTISVDFETLINREKVEGKVLCFQSGTKTFTILFQSPTLYKKRNEKMIFDLLDTFGCK